MQAALVTLQNLNGPGVGCPAASTTFLAQQKAIQDGTAPPAPAPAPAAPAPAPPAPAPAPAPAAGGVDPALVPQFGLASGINPTGTGDCDGITNAAGQVVKIPCACPPNRDAFIQVSLLTIQRPTLLTLCVVFERECRCWKGRQQPLSCRFLPH
jgi:hypothetical protein